MNDVTLVQFLLARVAEDEEWAQAAAEDADFYSHEKGYAVDHKWLRIARHTSGGRRSEHLDGVPSPPRVLAECEAKRRLLGWARIEHRNTNPVLRLLALPYADHPDYREEWRP